MEDMHKEMREMLLSGKARAALRKALEVEAAKDSDSRYGKEDSELLRAWEWHEVQAAPQTLNHLVTLGLVRIVYKSNSSTNYRLADTDRVKALLIESEEMQEEPEQGNAVPADLFDVVVLHEDKKKLLRMVLASEMPAHCLMIGEVGSSKTLFLQELSRLPSSRYVLGSSLSRAGLYELMFVERPKYLLVDEIDKVTDYGNVSALLSLMETGILAEVKYNKRRQGQFNCWVMAGCNNEDRIPPEILSRFGAFRLRFGVYTPEEFIEVVTKVLVMRERTDIELAKYIASVTLRRLNSRDVRVARSIARTAHTKQAVDDTVALLEKQGR